VNPSAYAPTCFETYYWQRIAAYPTHSQSSALYSSFLAFGDCSRNWAHYYFQDIAAGLEIGTMVDRCFLDCRRSTLSSAYHFIGHWHLCAEEIPPISFP